jgi:transposase
MRQEHRAGEKGFVDFSSDGVEVIDGVTGEVRIAKLFVAVLGVRAVWPAFLLFVFTLKL